MEGRFRSSGRFARGYVAGKLRLDPVNAALVAAGQERPFGRVLDLGCGRGQLGMLLLETGVATALFGIERDPRYLAQARAAAAGTQARFCGADLAHLDIPPHDTVLLIDVLYQLPEAVQLTLLERAAAAARGRLFLRVADPQRGWRSLAGRISEAVISQAGLLYRADAVRLLPVGEMLLRLERQGLACAVQPCWGRTPFANLLLTATRR